MSAIQITYPGIPSKTRELSEARSTIGRSPECSFVVPDAAMSKQHVALEAVLGNYFVYDLGSTNGTLINGESLVGKRVLKHRDVIEAGNTHIRFLEEVAHSAAFSTDTLMMIDHQTPVITIASGPNAGTSFEVSQLLTTIGKQQEQVAILQQKATGLYIKHIEGDATLLNGLPVGHHSVKLNPGDVLEICQVQLLIDFVDKV